MVVRDATWTTSQPVFFCYQIIITSHVFSYPQIKMLFLIFSYLKISFQWYFIRLRLVIGKKTGRQIMKLNHRITEVGKKQSLKLSSPTISPGPLCSPLNFVPRWHILLYSFMDGITTVSTGSMFPCCYSILKSLVKKFKWKNRGKRFWLQTKKNTDPWKGVGTRLSLAEYNKPCSVFRYCRLQEQCFRGWWSLKLDLARV